MSMQNFFKLVILLLFLGPICWADKLYINADSLTIRKDQQLAVYTGNVIAKFNEIVLSTNRVNQDK